MPQVATPVISGFNSTANLLPASAGDVWSTTGWTAAANTAALDDRITELEMTLTQAISDFAARQAQMISELRVLQAQIQSGLNLPDDPAALRRDAEREVEGVPPT